MEGRRSWAVRWQVRRDIAPLDLEEGAELVTAGESADDFVNRDMLAVGKCRRKGAHPAPFFSFAAAAVGR